MFKFKRVFILLFCLGFLVSPTLVLADIEINENLNEIVESGFKDINWGADISTVDNIVYKADSTEGIKICTIEGENCIFHKVKMDEVIYGFYNDKFCSVTMKFKGKERYEKLAGLFGSIKGGELFEPIKDKKRGYYEHLWTGHPTSHEKSIMLVFDGSRGGGLTISNLTPVIEYGEVQYFQPYSIHGERQFAAGSLQTFGERESDIPRMKGEKIFHFFISGDLGRRYAEFLPSKEKINVEKFLDKPCLFIGYEKNYDDILVAKENPDSFFVKDRPVIRMDVFAIEHIIPLKADKDVLAIDVPERFFDEFEFSVTVKNNLPIELIDSTLNISISPALFTIVDISNPELRDSNWCYSNSRRIDYSYKPGERKTYRFKIKPRDPSRLIEPETKFEISAVFAGYGVKGNKDKVYLEENQIKPIYSGERVHKYRASFSWIKD